ncbi:MAG: alpha/beta hydrolase [Caldilineaceae bacterium]
MSRNLRSGFAEINGARLYYEIAGSGRPLVMLHSHLLDSGQWDEQVAYFATTRQVIRYDARGFGQSDLPPVPFAYYKDLHGLLLYLGIDQADFIGCSGGGMTNLDFAVTYPQMVGKLILVGTAVSGYRPTTPPPPIMLAMNQARHNGEINLAVELSLQGLTDGPQRQPHEVDPAVRERTRAMTAKLFTRPPIPKPSPIGLTRRRQNDYQPSARLRWH